MRGSLPGGWPGCRERGAERGLGAAPSGLCSDLPAYKELTSGELPSSSETQFPGLKSEDNRDSFTAGPQTGGLAGWC